MKKQIKRRVFLWLLPVIVCVLSFGFLIAMMASFLGMQVEEESSDGTGCSVTGEVDVAKLNEGLKRAGVFQGKGQLFVDIAEKQGIDPILFIAISMSETGWGKSNAVREKK